MATNATRPTDPDACEHDGPVLGGRTCREDPLACQLASALAATEDERASYHLRQAMQLRLAERP